MKFIKQVISKHVASCRERFLKHLKAEAVESTPDTTALPCRQSLTTQLRVVGRDLVERVPIKNREVFRHDTLIEMSVTVLISFQAMSPDLMFR